MNKKFDVVDFLLGALSMLAPVPTGWAIYAGVREIPAFPMPFWPAALGSLAIVLLDVAAGDNIMAAKQFKDGLKTRTNREGEIQIVKKEAVFVQPIWWSWATLIFAVIAEMILALVIVVVDGALEYGVLVFPVLTVAGVFAFAVRRDLALRRAKIEALRKRSKKGSSSSSSSASGASSSAKKSASSASKKRSSASALREKCEALSEEYACSACDWRPDVEMLVGKSNPLRSAISSKSGHMKNNHPVPIPVDWGK